jgi:hypothetical protein
VLRDHATRIVLLIEAPQALVADGADHTEV